MTSDTGFSLAIEPIRSENTVGWDDTQYVMAASVPREGDGLVLKVSGKEYDVRVRWVYWTYQGDRLLPTVRVV